MAVEKDLVLDCARVALEHEGCAHFAQTTDRCLCMRWFPSARALRSNFCSLTPSHSLTLDHPPYHFSLEAALRVAIKG